MPPKLMAKQRTLIAPFLRALFLVVLLLVSLYPILPNWFNRTLPDTHDGWRYMLLGQEFAEALRAGVWYPRWLPEMNGGFGYPLFVFYQPGYFFLHAPSVLLTDDYLLRQLLTLSVIALAGGIGIYRLARCYVAPLSALVVVAVFQLSPYVHTDLFIRGDLSEWMVLQLVPWPVYCLQRFFCSPKIIGVRGRMAAWLGLVFSMAAICYCHPVAVMFLPALLLLLGGIYLARTPDCELTSSSSRLLLASELVCAIAAGLVLSAPYWLSVATMKPFVNAQVVTLGDFFDTPLNTTSVSSLLFGSLLDNLDNFNESEFLGWPFVMCALVGGWFGRGRPLVFAAGIAYLALFAAMTPLGRPLWRLYPFILMQFPWRLAVFAPTLQSLCAVGCWQMLPLRPSLRQGILLGLMAAMLGWSVPNHFGFKSYQNPFTQKELTCFGFFTTIASPGTRAATLDSYEWAPLSAQHNLLPARQGGNSHQECDALREFFSAYIEANYGGHSFPPPTLRPLLETTAPDWLSVPEEMHSLYHIRYRATGKSSSSIIINQLYLPGWVVLVNGVAISSAEIEKNLLPDGRIQLFLPAGQWHIQAWYDGPVGWRTQNGLILSVMLVSLIYWRKKLRSC